VQEPGEGRGKIAKPKSNPHPLTPLATSTPIFEGKYNDKEKIIRWTISRTSRNFIELSPPPPPSNKTYSVLKYFYSWNGLKILYTGQRSQI
jgi:hypothetical protein